MSDVCDLAPGYIRSIAPYQPGKPISELARELGLDPNGIIKLASNENPLGVSPLAMLESRYKASSGERQATSPKTFRLAADPSGEEAARRP